MIVARVIGACPSCAKPDSYGNVMVLSDHVLRGCKACQFSERIYLPELSKKIIYLDQFFFSAAFREKDSRFIEAAALIKRATAYQLLLSPYSSIHEEETHQWRGYNGQTKEDLMEFIKTTSRGHDFAPAYRIEHDQVLDAFLAFTTGKSGDFSLNQKTALRSDINLWENYFRVEVGSYRGDPELIRQNKNQSIEELVKNVFPNWRSSNATFDEHVKIEMQDAAKYYIKFYLEFLARIGAGDYDALFDSPIMSKIVQDMINILPRDQALEERISTIKKFFVSEHFFNVPTEYISSRMFAALRDQVKNGAFANQDEALSRLSGFFQDVKHISTYAPYVNAIVVDQPMASILNDGRVNLTGRFGTKVFSLNNWDQLLQWL
jgi:hypothetical protein